jgi:hypothetical protein
MDMELFRDVKLCLDLGIHPLEYFKDRDLTPQQRTDVIQYYSDLTAGADFRAVIEETNDSALHD